MPVKRRRSEFFATDIQRIVQTPEFVRVIFSCERRSMDVIMTPSAFQAMFRIIIDGPLPAAH